ncbi:MAG: GNAT family N-acetyltransferase [Caldimonas sp.]
MTTTHTAAARVFDLDLLARIEDAGINASAPCEQRWVDGWLVRFSPGKAKRARCIQAVSPGRLPIADKLERCLPIYAAAGLRPYVRITPFSEPAGLDAQLEALGMERIDDTRVMVALEFDPGKPPGGAIGHKPPPRFRIESTDSDTFVDWIGQARGSSADERLAHARRLAHVPVPHHAAFVVDEGGTTFAGGQVAIEGDLAGLYDVHTAEVQRGRGLARELCTHLLKHAFASGARIGYLQVDAGNEVARRIYRRLGFADAYAYHYRAG